MLPISAKVHAGRAETLREVFGCVTMRAVDRMVEAVGVASRLVAPGGWLALMTTEKDLSGLQNAAGAGFSWRTAMHLTGGDDRVLALGEREVNSRV